jgi:hypothetical protein
MDYNSFASKFQHKNFNPVLASDHPLCVGEHALPWPQRLCVSHLAYKSEWTGDTLAGIAEATGLNRKYGVKTAVAALCERKLVKAGKGILWVATITKPTKFIKVPWMTQDCPLTPLENFALWKLVDLNRKQEYVWGDHPVPYLGAMVGEKHRRSIYRATAQLERLELISGDWVPQFAAIKPEWYADEQKKKTIKQKRLEKQVDIWTSGPVPPPPPAAPRVPLTGMQSLLQYVREKLPPEMRSKLVGAIHFHVTAESAARVRTQLHLLRSKSEALGKQATYEEYIRAIENGKR